MLDSFLTGLVKHRISFQHLPIVADEPKLPVWFCGGRSKPEYLKHNNQPEESAAAMDAWLKVEQPRGTLTLLDTSYDHFSAVPSCSSEGLGFPELQVQATPGPLSQIHSQNPSSHVPVCDANIRVLFGCWDNIP